MFAGAFTTANSLFVDEAFTDALEHYGMQFLLSIGFSSSLMAGCFERHCHQFGQRKRVVLRPSRCVSHQTQTVRWCCDVPPSTPLMTTDLPLSPPASFPLQRPSKTLTAASNATPRITPRICAKGMPPARAARVLLFCLTTNLVRL